MRIVEIENYNNRCAVGFAVSTRGKRYRFVCWRDHDDMHCERETETLPKGGTFWLVITPPRALRNQIRQRLVN